MSSIEDFNPLHELAAIFGLRPFECPACRGTRRLRRASANSPTGRIESDCPCEIGEMFGPGGPGCTGNVVKSNLLNDYAARPEAANWRREFGAQFGIK